MRENKRAEDFDADPTAESNEVEIIEVVGVDDDDPAPAAGVDPSEPGDVVFALDADTDADTDLEDEFAEQPGEESTRKRGGTSEASTAESELLARLRADYDNLRKRVARERDDFQLQANSDLIEGLLPVLDNFERALQVEVGSGADGAFRTGMVMIYDQFHEALKNQGLRRIETVGQLFDPNIHDAVATDRESSAPVNTVVEEYQRGYLFQNRVLRPALVKVSTNGPPGNSPKREDGSR